jgi:predicted TIM-barrel fold metal-dependent hydrolase
MKIIDAHTHFYTLDRPDDATRYLLEQGLVLGGPDGAVEGLKKYMAMDNISISVNAPIAMNNEDVFTANRHAVEFNKHSKHNRSVKCLGTMHPNMGARTRDEMAFLAANGIKGIKMHPQVQGYYPDDEEMKVVYEACIKYKMFILLHSGAGVEPDFNPDEIKGTPERFKRVIDSYSELKMTIAHMGGLQMWDEAEKYLVGTGVMFDTAYCTIMDTGLLREIIKAHGADKVLFGSDFPWVRQKLITEKMEACGLTGDEMEKICWKNASLLMGLEDSGLSR